MSHLRTMQEHDLDRVIEIEAAAFGAWYRQIYGRERGVPPRTRTNVRSCLAKDPAGCFVAETDDQAVGMAVLWLTSGRQGPEARFGYPLVLALDPAHTDTGRFRALLAGTEAMIRAHGLKEILVPVNARHTWALEQLLHWEYRVERAMVRMVLAGTDRGPAVDHHVNLVRWAG